MVRRPAAAARAVPRRHRACARPRRRAPRRRAGREPGMGRRTCCGSRYQSLTTPTTLYDEDVADRRADVAAAGFPRPDVDLDALSDPTAVGHRRRRHAGAGRHRPPRRHARSTAPRRACSTATAPTSRRCRRGSRSARLSLLDRGFVWALAHPRGGGELGRQWYLDGKLLAKRNTFDDTIACGEHLVAERHRRRRSARDPRRQRRRPARRRRA